MIHRYVCDVLDEMRKMYETRNFAGFLGLVEEAQSMVNRMEAKLSEYKSGKISEERLSALDTKVRDKEKELANLNKETEKANHELNNTKAKLKMVRHQYMKETKGETILPTDNSLECMHCGSSHTGVCGPYDIG